MTQEKLEALLKIITYLINEVLTPSQIEKVRTDLTKFGLSADWKEVENGRRI
jgi:hypothetical protein